MRKKSTQASLAALLITATLGGGMFLIGQNAVGTSTAKAEAAATSVTASAGTVSQYEQLIAQYQTRESQYQAELSQAADQINSANQQLTTDSQQLQQYQTLIAQLESNGVITVASDGTVTINQSTPSGFFPFQDNHHGDNH